MITIVLRILWPGGVARIAVEEARNLGNGARLLIYRRANWTDEYDLSDVSHKVLREPGSASWITTLLRGFTTLYAPQRGTQATVDLDLIVQSASIVEGPALFHDQFAALTGFIRKLRTEEDYAVFVYETALGGSSGARWFLPKAIERAVLRGARLVLVPSRWNQAVLAEHGIGSEVVYPGCYAVKEPKADRKPIVLAVSLWDRGRYPDLYVELAKRLKGKMVMAGSWARREDLLEFRRRYGSKIIVTGPLRQYELDRLYSIASVYVRFGFTERGPGLGGLEAFAHGVPVIANEGIGMKELITEGEDGFVVKDRPLKNGKSSANGLRGVKRPVPILRTPDLDDAADKINTLLSEPLRLRRMAWSAWEKAKRLSWESHARRVRTLLESASSPPETPPGLP